MFKSIPSYSTCSFSYQILHAHFHMQANCVCILTWSAFLSNSHLHPRACFHWSIAWPVKVLHSTCQLIWKTQHWPQDWKRSVFIPIPKKGNAKEYSHYCTGALITHSSKVMLKILQARLQQYVNLELPDVQAGIRKGRGTRDKIANIHWIIEKEREFQKNIYFCFIDYAKAFDCVDDNKLENSLRDGNTRPAYPLPEKFVCRSRSNS